MAKLTFKIPVPIPKEIMDAVENGKVYFTPKEVAKVLHTSDMMVREKARAGRLEFPAIVDRTRVKIPKVPFLRWLGYDVDLKEADSDVRG